MTAIVILKRDIISNKAILGSLIYNDKEIAKTLENPWLNNIANISCIPDGVYNVISYSGTKYKDVYKLINVKGRTDILIHIGNTESNTQGCILVGDRYGFLKENIAILNSRRTLHHVKTLLPAEFTLHISSFN
tara:strand:- start:491 stop:889 length:399 start_codon:yes stop_codon:yes gene_type:complete